MDIIYGVATKNILTEEDCYLNKEFIGYHTYDGTLCDKSE